MLSFLPATRNFREAVSQLTGDLAPVASVPIFSSQGTKLIEAGWRVSPKLYERLLSHQLAKPIEMSLEASHSVNGKLLREQADKLIDRRPVLAQLFQQPAMRTMVLDALENVPLPPPIAFQLSVARDVYPALFQYCICTALIAGWLGAVPGALRYDISMLAATGLLQDIGMLHLDPVLLKATGALTPHQRRQMYSHPLVSALLLERHHEYPRELIQAVREHHELLDGSGYPAGQPGSRLSPWSRIVSLAQVVSALLRPGRSKATLRLSLLLRAHRHQYDPALCDRLLAVVLLMDRERTPASPSDFGALEPEPSPTHALIRIDRLLEAWPTDILQHPQCVNTRRTGMQAIGTQCKRMRRVLAEVGASAEQLAQLGDGLDDEMLVGELSLLAQEMAWQMRTLTRQAGDRWAPGADEALPPLLHAWVGAVHEGIAELVTV